MLCRLQAQWNSDHFPTTITLGITQWRKATAPSPLDHSPMYASSLSPGIHTWIKAPAPSPQNHFLYAHVSQRCPARISTTSHSCRSKKNKVSNTLVVERGPLNSSPQRQEKQRATLCAWGIQLPEIRVDGKGDSSPPPAITLNYKWINAKK